MNPVDYSWSTCKARVPSSCSPTQNSFRLLFFFNFFFYLTISKVNKTRAFWIVFQVELKFFCDVRKESEAGRCERSRMKSQNHRINLALGKFLTLTFLVTTGALQ